MNKAILDLKKMKKDLMFDFVCTANYFAGNIGAKIPVEEVGISRYNECFLGVYIIF